MGFSSKFNRLLSRCAYFLMFTVHNYICRIVFLPQVFHAPEVPLGQRHSYAPLRSRHSPPCWHGWLLHSSTSDSQYWPVHPETSCVQGIRLTYLKTLRLWVNGRLRAPPPPAFQNCGFRVPPSPEYGIRCNFYRRNLLDAPNMGWLLSIMKYILCWKIWQGKYQRLPMHVYWCFAMLWTNILSLELFTYWTLPQLIQTFNQYMWAISIWFYSCLELSNLIYIVSFVKRIISGLLWKCQTHAVSHYTG